MDLFEKDSHFGYDGRVTTAMEPALHGAAVAPVPVRDHAQAAGATTLADLPAGTSARVVAVQPPGVGGGEMWPQQLADLGFTPGERVTVLRRGWPGGDPVAVRVGVSTFALRRAEAACVRVEALEAIA
jgi:ferrous iron transport protein A